MRSKVAARAATREHFVTLPRPAPPSFRTRFARSEVLLGTFIKTPTTHAIEIVGDRGFDFVVIDEEHAPFDRIATDMALLAARAAETAGLVRVASADPAGLLSVPGRGARLFGLVPRRPLRRGGDGRSGGSAGHRRVLTSAG
jgi:hypothetical protein